MNKYPTYKEIDFLTDDYFVESMLKPTMASKAYWQKLIEEKLIPENEFLTAFRTLKQLHESSDNPSPERIEHIWHRIETTNQKNRKKSRRKTFILSMSAACIVILVTLLPYPFFFKKDSAQIAAIENDTIIHANPGNNIQLISMAGTVNLEGNNVSIEYDEKNSVVKINNETIEIKEDDRQSEHDSHLIVPYGKRAFIKLSDGTSIWINSGSKIRFPHQFTDKERRIFVEGEIYADIVKDEEKPFIISTEKLNVKVLGTQFNLSAYRDEKTSNVVLVKGSVYIEPQKGTSTIIAPNQLYTYDSNVSTVETINVEEYVSWKDGRLIFQNEPIEKILLRLSRYYNVTMILPKTSSGITCSGRLELKEDIDKILNGLMEIITFNYAVNKNEYRIRFN